MAAYLTIEGTDVPVAWPDGADHRVAEIGDRARAFLGNLLASIRALPVEVSIRTRPMSVDDADDLYDTLTGQVSLSCSGDLLGGSMECNAEVHGRPVITVANNERRAVLSFTLHQIDV